MAGTVWLEKRLSGDCVEMDLLHPRRKWDLWLWLGCGGMSLTSLCGVDQVVLYYWHCLWTSKFLGLLGWCCCGLSILAAHFLPRLCSEHD